MPVDGDTSGLDLPVGDVGVLQCLDAVVTESHRRATAGDTTLPGVVLLAVLDFTGNQHDLALRAFSGGLDSGSLRRDGDCRLGGLFTGSAAGFGARRGGARRTTAARAGARGTLAARTVGGGCGGGQLTLATDDVALVDPHLYADTAERGLRLVKPVVDVGAQGVQRNPAFAVELRAAHLGAAEATRALHADALDVGLAHGRLDGLAHRAAERHTVAQLLGDTLGDQLRDRLGVLHLEDVQLDLLAGQLLQVGADAVGLGTTTADHDARTRGVDVNADPVTGALDLHVGDAGTLEAGGQQPPDRHVFLDVVGVLLVGVPPGLPVGGDTEPEAVGVDFLAHYSEPSFVCSAVALAAEAFLAGAFLAGAVAAALLPCARRERAALAEADARSLRAGRLSTITVMWLVRLRIRYARPCARGRMRLAVGPSSAMTVATTRVAGSRPSLFCAFAAAEAITLATGSLACCGAQRRMSRASSTDLPRTRLITRRALLAEIPTYFATAVAEGNSVVVIAAYSSGRP
ncbi:Folylpolyglutamate synthase (modular protein) [uncultured Mycobacterium sp.]|uniref:Folylpolyglutamate synthase (Modular protein) n=1 Tax=uncultured Mycobacterium sp. TaxID=171292 RepID=A0A1Y5PJ15_9MYCO|nr:Folylpolyglutamate synthase (modular protein) [uncultured Mycobacterium sp.]